MILISTQELNEASLLRNERIKSINNWHYRTRWELSADFLYKKVMQYMNKKAPSSFNSNRIDHIYQILDKNPRFVLFYGDLTDSSNLIRIIQQVKLMKV